MHFRNSAVVTFSLISSLAWGQPQPSDETSSATAVQSEPTSAERWDQAHLKVPPWTEPSGQGVGIGYEHGSWAGNWAQELRLRIPVWRAFGLHLGGLYLHDEPGGAENLGGRILLTGATPVYLNLVRIYGGGGIDMMTAVNQANAPLVWSGGGFFGFEFFMNHRSSFFIEIGGRGEKYSGATIMAGMNLFPFS